MQLPSYKHQQQKSEPTLILHLDECGGRLIQDVTGCKNKQTSVACVSALLHSGKLHQCHLLYKESHRDLLSKQAMPKPANNELPKHTGYVSCSRCWKAAISNKMKQVEGIMCLIIYPLMIMFKIFIAVQKNKIQYHKKNIVSV